MTVISAYVDLFIGGKCTGRGNVRIPYSSPIQRYLNAANVVALSTDCFHLPQSHAMVKLSATSIVYHVEWHLDIFPGR